MERKLLEVIDMFAREAQKMESRRNGIEVSFTINVALPSRYNSDRKPRVKLEANFFNGENYETVKAASFDRLIDECWRRMGFIDRESMKNDEIEASLVALPGPTEL